MPGRAPLNSLAWEHSPEQRMIQDVVREFVEHEALPVLPECFERGEFPRQLISRLGQLGVLGPTIPGYGCQEQQQRYLPKLHTGELIGCFGLTEHEHGSDPSGMETRAVRDGDCFVLNGGKMWITNGNLADVALVWAKVDEDGQDVVRGFLVETDV